MNPSPPTRSATRDYGFVCLMVLLAANAGWLLLMPWVPSIAGATLRRFHLHSDSFVGWAAQFPVPSMYNFANRFSVTEYPPGLVDPILIDQPPRYINHFPTRVISFADTRFRYLNPGQDRWFDLESSYRGQRLRTHWHARPRPGGGYTIVRLPAERELP